ncbi:MAG: Hsp20/alpha crystallin family protein [Phycisphaerae bacterium]|nr:Hsp20/alpha crystallin family protein [Phycisphaerae bacterium]
MAHVIELADRREPKRLDEHFARWADQIIGPPYRKYRGRRGWSPPANFCEYADHYCLIVELAGMSAERIDLRVEPPHARRQRMRTAGTLLVSGERPAPQAPESPQARYLHLMEIDHGPFSKSFELPPDADVDSIEAVYRTGYLCVRIAKKR